MDYLLKYRYVVALLLILMAVFGVYKIPSITINTDFSQFLDQSDEEYIFFKTIQSQFEMDESLLVLAIKNDPGVLEINFLKKVDSLTKKIKDINYVKSVGSITNMAYPIKSMFGISRIPYLTINDTVPLTIADAKIRQDQRITNYFINENRTVLILWITLEKDILFSENQEVLDKIAKVRKEFPANETFIWGKSYIKSTMDALSAKETTRNILWSLLFLTVLLVLIFSRIQAILFTLFYIFITVLIFYGGMIFFNRPFGIMSNLYPTIILIVGISDVIHFSIKYNEEISAGASPNFAYIKTVKEIGQAICITSITTAIGFFTLAFSPIKALNDFGLEAGISVMLTFVIFMALAPTAFYGFKKGNLFELRPSFLSLSSAIQRTLSKTQRHPKTVLTGTLLILLLSLIGIKSINTNNLQYSIPPGTEFHSNYVFFENIMGGSRIFELYFIAKGGHHLNTAEELKAIHATYSYLDSLPYFTQVKSPTLYYQLMDRAYHPDKSLGTFDITTSEIQTYEKDLQNYRQVNYLMNRSRAVMKISAQMKDIGRRNVSQRNEVILKKVRSILDTTKIDAKISGLDHLFDRTHESRIHNMLYGLLTAIVMIAFILGLLYRSIPIVIIALILNIIPIVITAGIMGLTQLELRAGTSVIFTIAFVIAVDDTVHFLNKFKWERQSGNTIKEALIVTIRECGTAIWTTSLILTGAFFVLLFSNLNEIFSFGLLIGIAIILAFLTDLILAPILILHWFKKYL